MVRIQALDTSDASKLRHEFCERTEQRSPVAPMKYIITHVAAHQKTTQSVARNPPARASSSAGMPYASKYGRTESITPQSLPRRMCRGSIGVVSRISHV